MVGRKKLTPEQELQKEAVKEGIKEWMDDNFMSFGKWTAVSFACILFAALLHFVLWTKGWRQ